MIEVKLSKDKSIEVSENIVTFSEYYTFLEKLNINPTIIKKYKKKNPITDINFIEVIEYINYMSKEKKLSPCYKFLEDSNSPEISNADGFRLPTLNEWKQLVDIYQNQENPAIKHLKGLVWQWTETIETHKFSPEGKIDIENPKYLWSYRIIVGGSNYSSKEFLKGYPCALMLDKVRYETVGFRIVRGKR